jgi:hypothetical protein
MNGEITDGEGAVPAALGGKDLTMVAETKATLRDWIEQEHVDNNKRILKLSDAKDKFPTIHMKWIELAFAEFEQEKLLLAPEARSRVRLFEINSKHFLAKQAAPTAAGSKRSLGSTSASEGNEPRRKVAKDDALLSPSKKPSRTKAALSPSKNVSSPAKSPKGARSLCILSNIIALLIHTITTMSSWEIQE